MKVNILLVEDETDLQFVIRIALESAGLTVITASNSLEALEYLAHNAVDLLLVDVLMPGMNGLELCEQLQQHPVWQHIPVILLTASSQTSILPAELPPVVRMCVNKPFDVFTLVDQVQAFLTDSRREGPPAHGSAGAC